MNPEAHDTAFSRPNPRCPLFFLLRLFSARALRCARPEFSPNKSRPKLFAGLNSRAIHWTTNIFRGLPIAALLRGPMNCQQIVTLLPPTLPETEPMLTLLITCASAFGVAVLVWFAIWALCIHAPEGWVGRPIASAMPLPEAE